MTRITRTLTALTGLLVLSLGTSCTIQQTPEVQPIVVEPDAYELFVKAHPKYPKTMSIYRNAELLRKADPTCPIYICISQQRGRLYVDGKVAADWPVSTGTTQHPTPLGTFRVTEKKRRYSSRTWGKILDADGKCVNSNADSRTDTIPPGGQFIGSPMPNWQRLTGNGIGMHTGKVRAGRRLSHGCIRTPSRMASDLFGITATGRTRVTVCQEVEACYPTFTATATTPTTPAPVPVTTISQQQPTPELPQVVVEPPVI